MKISFSKAFFSATTFIILFTTQLVNSQIAVNTWRTHFSYDNIISIADAGNIVYAANELSLFSYEKAEGYIEKLNKVTNLSDAGISFINYNKKSNSLFIAYSNSNIDIIKNDTIFNFSEIKRKQINGNKRINNVAFKGDTAYLACAFGIVLFDTKNLEFIDTYYIGEDAAMINVNKITYTDTHLYAATSSGIYYADFSVLNIADYRNWVKMTDIPTPDFSCNEIESNGDIIYISQTQDETGKTIVYKYDNFTTTIFDSELNWLHSIDKNNDLITFCNDGKIKVYNKYENIELSTGWYSFEDTSTWLKANYAITDDDKNLWIADKRFALVGKIYQKKTYSIKPNGPRKNFISKLIYANNKIYATSGSGTSQSWAVPEYFIFEEEEWSSYKLNEENVFQFYPIAVHPDNPNRLFLGSWTKGIYEFIDNKLVNNYNDANSSLQNYSGYTRINDLIFDNNKNLWVANWYVGKPISVLTDEGNWHSYNFNGQLNNKIITGITLMSNNTKWLKIGQNSGIFAFNDNDTPENEDDDQYKSFYPITSEGEVVSQNIYSIAEDLDGNVWVGTDNGVVIYYNPDDIFENNLTAERVQLTSYGKDTTEQYLLSTDMVTKIAIDGANRKWIGTQSSGLFLVSETGKEEIHNFNVNNSPLLSNTIYDIAIDPKSGEVFIANAGGIVSFRSDATKAPDYFENVYVFPNPVRPDYTGKITITGLAQDVNVKITDISGNLVFETKALGGQAIWDGNTLSNRRVSTGVYMIFCTNTDGSQTFVTKLLFIN